MLYKNYKKGFSLIEMAIVVAIIGILIAIVVPSYQKIVSDVKKKACIANMGTIFQATRMFYMENPKGADFEGVSVDYLLKQNYLKTDPRCPNSTNLTKSEAFYAIMDKAGKKIDIICVNTHDTNMAHGKYSELTQPQPQPKP